MAECDDDGAFDLSLDGPAETDAVPTIRQALVAVIRAGRARLGWTVEQLAVAAGVDRKTVDRIINGHRAPLGTVERLLCALGLASSVASAIEDQATDPGLDP